MFKIFKQRYLPSISLNVSSLKTTTLVWLITGSLILLFSLACLLFLSSVNDYKRNLNKLDSIYDEQSILNNTWESLLQTRNTLNRASSRHLLIINKMATANTDISSLFQQTKEKLVQVENNWNIFKNKQHQVENEEYLTKLENKYVELHAALIEFLGFLEQGKTYEYLNQPTQTYQDNFEKEYNTYHQQLQNHYTTALNEGELLYDKIIYSLIVISVLIIIFSFLVQITLKKYFISPLNKIMHSIEDISNGELTSSLTTKGLFEINNLTFHIEKMKEQIKKIINNINQSANSINLELNDITVMNNNLAIRVEQQSAAVLETSAGIRQLSVTAKQHSENTHTSCELVMKADSMINQSNEMLANVVENMNEVVTFSEQINDITTTIDNIAFQTNLLALNAAVEAARVGEYGRGFAVVAKEVRELSNSCNLASKEIKVLVANSSKKINQCFQLAADANDNMVDISKHTANVNEMIHDISISTDEQSNGIAQIEDAINQLDQTTQANSVMTRDLVNSLDLLQTQSNRLKNELTIFHQ
ncbi:methyl-accepting chemotaxis protein [Proteus hauseri ATCC 700826]|uniref:Methyl-accepting chemotaxis protein n=1 Tax=Proteus hauseri ATCC 700826 TaxID=1354271 RepID=A0AAJ3HSE8_PROHU|nr:methyl-accepting chemotaxis protein [Proteus hauseri]OAT47159.1 methyl-accepting chemotaxis protein [Proteus hauseri ATCC 700826]